MTPRYGMVLRHRDVRDLLAMLLCRTDELGDRSRGGKAVVWLMLRLVEGELWGDAYSIDRFNTAFPDGGTVLPEWEVLE